MGLRKWISGSSVVRGVGLDITRRVQDPLPESLDMRKGMGVPTDASRQQKHSKGIKEEETRSSFQKFQFHRLGR